MTELKRAVLDGTTDEGTPTRRWVVSGPAGAVALNTILGILDGCYTHSLVDTGDFAADVESCDVVAGKRCWGDALAQSIARRIYGLRAISDDAVFEALEAEYRHAWPGGGRCGESVPQAGYVPPNAGSAS